MSTRPRTPGHGAPAPGKLPITELLEMKRSHSPIAMITAYDAPSGRLADAAGVDMILVGDSAAMTVLGHDSTVPATMDEMLVLARAVRRGAKRPLIVADMPFGSFQISDELAVTNAVRFVKEAGADAVKLEGAGLMLDRARAIVGAGVPVMGHIGLTPQSATALGGFKAQGRTAAKAAQLVHDALALEEAGCFALVLEAVPTPVAAQDHRAARDSDDRDRRRRRGRRPGARLARPARPLRRPCPALREAVRPAGRGIQDAVEHYVGDVRERRFPEEVHTYGMPVEELEAFDEGWAAVRACSGCRGSGPGLGLERVGTTPIAATITAASVSAPATAARAVRMSGGGRARGAQRPEGEDRCDPEYERPAGAVVRAAGAEPVVAEAIMTTGRVSTSESANGSAQKATS